MLNHQALLFKTDKDGEISSTNGDADIPIEDHIWFVNKAQSVSQISSRQMIPRFESQGIVDLSDQDSADEKW